MRKKLLFPFVMICMFISSFAFAQTTVTLYMANAPQYNPCIVPQDVMFNYYGHVNGYLPADTITLYANWGDGTDTTVYRDSVYTSFYGNIMHYYSFPGVYSTYFILSGPDGKADTVINMDQVLLSGTCGNISGTVYVDTNTNCVIDPAEERLQGISVKLYHNGLLYRVTTTDTLGNYAFQVPSGTSYDVKIDTVNLYGYSFTCPTGGIYSNVNPTTNGLNFGLICSNPGFDLSGYLQGSGFRPNLNANIWLYMYNYGCLCQPGQVKLLLDPRLHFVSCNPPAFAVNGDTVIWNHSGVCHYDWFSAQVVVHTDPTVVVGDSVNATVFFLPLAGDVNPSDNIIHRKFPVRNSWDPNMKDVTPAGNGLPGYISPGTKLDYTVYFQNTGNDVAHNIFIMDKLDDDLDLSTYQLLSSSHPVEVFLLAGNTLKFNFNHIMLPDSGTNLAGSQGYVTYTVSPKSMLINGTEITNQADIYFDFNPAIQTNEVLNTIDLSVGKDEQSEVSSVLVVPNPMNTKAVFTLNKNIAGNVMLEVFDMSGKLVRASAYSSGEQIVLDRGELTNGVFYYRLSDEQSNMIGSGKLVVL